MSYHRVILIPSYVEIILHAYRRRSACVPTGYVETTYRRGLFGRRWIVERPVIASYYPTAYVADDIRLRPMCRRRTYPPTCRRRTSRPPTTRPRIGSAAIARQRTLIIRHSTKPLTPAAADICCDTVVVDSTVRSVPQSNVPRCPEPQGSRVQARWTSDAIDSIRQPTVAGGDARATIDGAGQSGTAHKPTPTRISADSPPNPPPLRPTETPRPKPRPKVPAATPRKNDASEEPPADVPATKKAAPRATTNRIQSTCDRRRR